MAQGIVFGTVMNRSGTRCGNARVILDTVHPMGSGVAGPNYMQITPVSPIVGCPPYGVAATTDATGNYALLYSWEGRQLGDVFSSARYRVMAFDLASYRFLGAASRNGGVIGADLRSLVSTAFPTATFPGDSPCPAWFNFIADQIRRVPSGAIRGMLGDTLSTERQNFVTRINILTR